MSSSKKNLFTIIIVTSILLFAFAIYWKMNNPDNSEVISVKPVVLKTQNPKSTIENKGFDFLEDTVVINTNTETVGYGEFATQKEARKALSNTLTMSLMYDSPEKVMKSIVIYQDRGNNEKVDELVAFLLERFPEYDLPKNF